MDYRELGYDNNLQKDSLPTFVGSPETRLNPYVQQSGGRYETSDRDARLRIYPDRDKAKEVGMVSTAADGTETFKILIGGTDSGDVSLGDYAGGQGVKYDHSAGKTLFSSKLIQSPALNVWTPSFLAPDPSAVGNDSYMIGNGNSEATENAAVIYRDSGAGRLYVTKYQSVTYLPNRFSDVDKSGYVTAGSVLTPRGGAYYGTNGLYRDNNAGNARIIRIDDAATAASWTYNVAETGTDYGVDTDGTGVFFPYQNGSGNFLRSITLSAGTSASDSSDNGNLVGCVGCIYYNSFLWLFSYSSGTSYVSKYSTALSLQATTTISDTSFSGLLVFRVDNTGKVYCMPDGTYDGSNREIYYLLDLNDL